MIRDTYGKTMLDYAKTDSVKELIINAAKKQGQEE